jgi:hypothetical protein
LNEFIAIDYLILPRVQIRCSEKQFYPVSAIEPNFRNKGWRKLWRQFTKEKKMERNRKGGELLSGSRDTHLPLNKWVDNES